MKVTVCESKNNQDKAEEGTKSLQQVGRRSSYYKSKAQHASGYRKP